MKVSHELNNPNNSLNDIKSLENEQQQDSSIDIVEKLKDINSLLESGVISAEEFEQATKK